MIKNNLNIAQQVNCSGISSSLFLFFDSKALCAGCLLHASRPKRGARTPSSTSPCGRDQASRARRPLWSTSRYALFAPECCCTLWGRDVWWFSLPTEPLGSKEEKNEHRKKHSPLPSGPELSKAQANRRTPVFKCLLCHCHKPKATALITSPCVFGITFFPKKSTRHKYSGNKPFTLKPQPQFAWHVKKPAQQQLPQ